MEYYVIIEANAYHLHKGRYFQIGDSPECDIQLACERVQIESENQALIINGKSYTQSGSYSVEAAPYVLDFLVLSHGQSLWMNQSTIYLSQHTEADIQLAKIADSVIQKQGDTYTLITEDTVFVNGHQCEQPIRFRAHDQLLFKSGHVLSVDDNCVQVSSLMPITSKLLAYQPVIQGDSDRASEFHRSPRIILREPIEQVTISAPPTEEEYSKQSLLKSIAMPLVMISLTILMLLMRAGHIMMFMMLGMSSVTIVMSVHTYFSDQKKHKEKQSKKIRAYEQYLDKKYRALYTLRMEQVAALKYHYPTFPELLEMASGTDRRLYEKTPHYFDFLTYQIGSGKVASSFKVTDSKSELTQYNKQVVEKVEDLINSYKTLEDMPIQTALLKGPVGYIGTRRTVVEQLHQLVIQLAAFHSYHDIQFVPIFREDELPLWQWSRWLPHMHLQAFNSRGFIYNQRTRDQLLTTLYQVMKDRKADSERQEQGVKKVYLPHYVLLITDISLLLDHSIIEFINEDLTALGFSYIFVEEVLESLPEHVATIIDFEDDRKGTLLLQYKEYVNQIVKPLERTTPHEKETFARYMAGIQHVLTLRNAIPEAISFLEMYGVTNIADLQILNRWQTNEVYQSMAVPIGVRGKDDILYLNLHEKAHGPHGLIAGTTGSGKSELIQSYILSLALNYHPYEVAFLLIDYKGGGMANLFKDLPHLVGTITNLDAKQSERALESIKAELKKRQRLFGELNVNHINQYNKLFKEQVASEPLPHLFIISDEFAELKTEQPDFMQELVSAARIGRSLGIHLILATQKPNGVVNAQIWSNSRFKIALKVQDAADSREIIRTADAAEITQAGRAYLQVGNNEIYELFQSAWSGAEYIPDGRHNASEDNLLYEIMPNGQYLAINKDLSGLDKVEHVSSVATQLEALIEEMRMTFEQTGLQQVASPWLPPLATRVYATQFQSCDFVNYWQQLDTGGLQPILVGYQDIPQRQEQSPLYFNMIDAGHIVVLSSPGYGKSTFLQSVAIDIMRKHEPDKVHFYLFDFGTSGLIGLSDFPHVADYFAVDETEKIKKALRRLAQQIKERKELLAKRKMATVEIYNQVNEVPLPYVFVFVDSYDGIAATPYEEYFTHMTTLLSREGAALGMYLMISLGRMNALKFTSQGNFKTKIGMYLFNNNDLSYIVGHSRVKQEEIPGRALMKDDEMVEFQVMLPYEADNYFVYREAMNREMEQMNQQWKGKRPAKIPMLPEQVTPSVIKEMTRYEQTADRLIVGLYTESVLVASFALNQAIMMFSDNVTYIRRYLQIIQFEIQRLGDAYNTLLIDVAGKVPARDTPELKRYDSVSEVKSLMSQLISSLKERIAQPDKTYKKWVVILTDIANTISRVGVSIEDYKLIVDEASKYGMTFIFVGNYRDLVANYDGLVGYTKQNVSQALIGMRLSDQEYRKQAYIAGEPQLQKNSSYLMTDEGHQLVQLTEINGE